MRKFASAKWDIEGLFIGFSRRLFGNLRGGCYTVSLSNLNQKSFPNQVGHELQARDMIGQCYGAVVQEVNAEEQALQRPASAG